MAPLGGVIMRVVLGGEQLKAQQHGEDPLKGEGLVEAVEAVLTLGHPQTPIFPSRHP